MNSKQNIGRDKNEHVVDDMEASLRRLERRSSLLRCISDRPSPTSTLTPSSPTISLSPLIQRGKVDGTFVIRDSKQAMVAICQRYGKQQFMLYCPRPLEPGQKPSLTMGGRILYMCGRVTVHDQHSGNLFLWNGQLAAVNNLQNGLWEILDDTLRLDSPSEADNASTVLSSKLQEFLPICLKAIFSTIK